MSVYLLIVIEIWTLKSLVLSEIVGVLATLEKFMMDAEEKGNQFLISFLGKQHTRLKGIFDRHIV